MSRPLEWDGGEVDRAVGQIAPPERIGAAGRWSAASELALHVALAVGLLGGLLLFYGSHYSVHQDLAGSALSGRLAVTLGNAFRDYVLYFPPAERTWFSLAARLTDLTGLRLDLSVVLMTGVAILFSTGLAYWIRRKAVGASPLFLILSVAVLVVLPILFKNVFGLREHMVVLGLWPYLVLRASDPDNAKIGWRVRLLVGLWLGAALLFKYLYCAVVVLVEAADAVLTHKPFLLLRLENIAAGTVVGLYLFCWLVLDSTQRSAIGAMMSAIDANLADPAANRLQVISNLYPAIFLLLAFRFSKLPGRLAAIGLALVMGAIVAAWAQERWYSHHLFPITMAYAAWWWMAGRRLKWWGHLIVPLVLVPSIFTEYRSAASYQEAVDELDDTLARAGQSVAGKRVGILTMHPSPYNQYLASHRSLRWNGLMNNAYVAAELQQFDRPENAGKAPPPVKLDNPGRRKLHDEMLRLWEDMPPDVLILDHSYRWPLRYIDVQWTHVFSKDPRFNAILKHYRPVLAHRGKRLEFKYYVRAD
jgi:hypothetical protein